MHTMLLQLAVVVPPIEYLVEKWRVHMASWQCNIERCDNIQLALAEVEQEDTQTIYP